MLSKSMFVNHVVAIYAHCLHSANVNVKNQLNVFQAFSRGYNTQTFTANNPRYKVASAANEILNQMVEAKFVIEKPNGEMHDFDYKEKQILNDVMEFLITDTSLDDMDVMEQLANWHTLRNATKFYFFAHPGFKKAVQKMISEKYDDLSKKIKKIWLHELNDL